MEKGLDYYKVMEKSILFGGIAEDDLRQMLPCLSAKTKEYGKGEFILHAGDISLEIGMVLTGTVDIIKEDYWGNSNIVAKLERGDTFAESYACDGSVALDVSVQAGSNCKVLFMDVQRIMKICTPACVFHQKLITNLLSLLATKNLFLNNKLTHMVQRTTREKLLSYLSSESVRHNANRFDIPFNRQQLADYLSVDRSAMSNELCKMRDEGILKFDKNHFILMEDE